MPDCQPEIEETSLSGQRSFDRSSAQRPVTGPRLLLAAHSQTPGFQTLPCLVAGPTLRPTPEVLPRLAMLFVCERSCSPVVTSLVGVTPRASARMCGSPRHSFRVPVNLDRDFPRQKKQAPGYPSHRSSSPFGTVSTGTHWQALTGRSWLSSSSAGPFCYRPHAERWLIRPVRLSPGQRLPTPAGLNEPPVKIPPWPGPPGRDWQVFPCDTRFESLQPPVTFKSLEVFPCRPSPEPRIHPAQGIG
jgi:hypothetical protein